MSWFKEYGFSIAGVMVGAFIVAQTGFNLGVEARADKVASQQAPAKAETAHTLQGANPHIN